MWVISDVHTGDHDTRRVDAEGRVGRDEVVRFFEYAEEKRQNVLEAGDAINYPPRLWRSLELDYPVWMVRQDAMVTILPGNHDPIRALALGYVAAHEWPIDDFRCMHDCLIMHGHQFDPFWRDRNGGLGTRLRLWLGHEAIALAESVPARWDDTAMHLAHKVRNAFIPRGSRLPREAFALRAATYARATGFEWIILGHLHELWHRVVNGVHVVCLGSWVPSGTWPGRFRAGVFDTEEKRLFEWRDGLVEWEEGDGRQEGMLVG